VGQQHGVILRRYRTQNQAFRGQDVVHARQTIYPVRAGRPVLSGVHYVPEQTSYTAMKRGTAVITASRDSCGEAMACRPDQRHFRLTVIVR
jgi:hypothetical protein